MFNTPIHWTTFFYLLVDTFILLFAFIQSAKLKNSNLNRYLFLGLLFVTYNLTGGFLPFEKFPGPIILQYIITYGVAITMSVYLIYYFLKEYDIDFLNPHLTIANIVIYSAVCFFGFFLFPYYLSSSIEVARISFIIPISFICIYILWAFYNKISNPHNPNKFVIRRNKLSLISISGIVLLPFLTLLGDYQWLTFTVVNTSFFTITAIEIDRYLFFLEHKNKLTEVFAFYKNNEDKQINPKFFHKSLTRREIEIALSILDNRTYKEIGEDFFIAESTVSKHASNIFKKTDVKNRTEFIDRFSPKKT